MDVRFINPFVASILNTFDTMCALKVTIGKPSIKAEPYEPTDVSAIIGFSGDVAGSVALCLCLDVAARIATSFAGTEITPEHEDFGDALGELANMVAGGAKAKLDGFDVDISLPTVVFGKDMQISTSKTAPRLLIPCSTDMGDFRVEVGMKTCKQQPNATQGAAVGANL